MNSAAHLIKSAADVLAAMNILIIWYLDVGLTRHGAEIFDDGI